jgi:hypothetical protein
MNTWRDLQLQTMVAQRHEQLWREAVNDRLVDQLHSLATRTTGQHQPQPQRSPSRLATFLPRLAAHLPRHAS